MGQFNYDDFLKKEQNKPQGNFEKGNIKFLSNYLQNDGDMVLVRFPYGTPNDFTFYSLHRVSVEGKFRNVLCLRNDNEPVQNCPLCAKGDNAKDKILIQCIAYIQGEKGIEIVPCVWERPAKFARKIADCIEGFGNSVYKITRSGAKGSQNTDYNLIPAGNPQIYNEQAYPSDFSGFNNFKFNNFMFLDRTYDELVQFVQTGSMPQRQKQENAQPQNYNQQPTYPQAPQQTYAQPQGFAQPQQYAQPQGYAQAEANPFNQSNVAPQQPQQFNWQQGATQQQPQTYSQPQQPENNQQQGTTQRPVRTYY